MAHTERGSESAWARRNNVGGTALIAGAASGLFTMALHPTGNDALANAASGGHNALAIGVHVLAIASIPVVLCGLLVLSTRLAAWSDLAWGAFVTYCTASVAILVAAVASGLLVPALIANYASANDALREVIRSQMYFAGQINQAFAKVFVMLSAASILLWSSAMWRTNAFSKSLAVFGFVISLLLLGAAGSGHLALNVHGFGAVVLAEAIWLVWAGATLRALPEIG